MDQQRNFAIDWNERFPSLASAPLVEAVARFSARAEHNWTPEYVEAGLASLRSDYPECQPVHEVRVEIEGTPDNRIKAAQQNSWTGIRLSTTDRLGFLRMTPDGLVVSRLKPYYGWDAFSAETIRAWDIYRDLAKPSAMQRFELRFINLIPLDSKEPLAKILKEPPSCPSSLPLAGFLYQSTFKVPDRYLSVKVVKTLKPGNKGAGPGLILDINVFTTASFSVEMAEWGDLLPTMRWLKNRVFFDLLTPDAIERFGKG